LPFAPRQSLAAVFGAGASVAGAMVGYVSPFTEPLLALFAPSATFRAAVIERRPVSVDPILGLPLTLVAKVAPEGRGAVRVSNDQPVWAGVPVGSLGGLMRRVAGLERWPEAALGIDAVVGPDGSTRYVVELAGIRHLGIAADPQDLSGAVSAMVLPATAYTRCVTEALDAAGVPRGAQVMLVGHSQGGIVAMDLAGDPAFNGDRVQVTDVLVAGSPISSKQAAAGSGTRIFSIENVDDVVTHLDAVDSAARACTPQRFSYQFADDQHSIGATHSANLYAEHLDSLADSPNPLLRDFDKSVSRYLTGTTTTTVFTLSDAPAS
jgi:PGAP1-like protein